MSSLPSFELKALDEIADIADPAARRRAVLRKLEHIYETALNRERTVPGKRGSEPHVYVDPDCNGAVAAMREAIPLLTIEPISGKPSGSALAGKFERPKLESVK